MTCSVADHDRHDALWREQCSNIQTVLKVQPGNSPHQLMAVVYPGVAWDPMWAIVALCNEAVRSFNAGPDGTKQLPPGTILNLPVFQLPQPAAAGQAGKDPTVSNDTSNSRSITEGSSMESLASTLQSDPVTAHTCGCGAEIQVTQLSSWLQIALAAYPGINPLQITALLLSLCNPHAAMAPDNQLLPGQHLVPICSSTLEASLASFAEVLRSSYMLPTVNTTASTGSAATAEASGISAHPQQEGAVCTVETLSGQGTHLRQVALWPAGAAAGAANAQQLCPWYADGCSGPTQGLQYQDVMTPCCNAHGEPYGKWLGLTYSVLQSCMQAVPPRRRKGSQVNARPLFDVMHDTSNPLSLIERHEFAPCTQWWHTVHIITPTYHAADKESQPKAFTWQVYCMMTVLQITVTSVLTSSAGQGKVGAKPVTTSCSVTSSQLVTEPSRSEAGGTGRTNGTSSGVTAQQVSCLLLCGHTRSSQAECYTRTQSALGSTGPY